MCVFGGGGYSCSLEDGRQVQMQVPPDAAPGSLVQFELPPPPILVSAQTMQPGSVPLDAKANPLTSSIEMRSMQPEVRLSIDTPAAKVREIKPLSKWVSQYFPRPLQSTTSFVTVLLDKYRFT